MEEGISRINGERGGNKINNEISILLFFMSSVSFFHFKNV